MEINEKQTQIWITEDIVTGASVIFESREEFDLDWAYYNDYPVKCDVEEVIRESIEDEVIPIIIYNSDNKSTWDYIKTITEELTIQIDVNFADFGEILCCNVETQLAWVDEQIKVAEALNL